MACCQHRFPQLRDFLLQLRDLLRDFHLQYRVPTGTSTSSTGSPQGLPPPVQGPILTTRPRLQGISQNAHSPPLGEILTSPSISLILWSSLSPLHTPMSALWHLAASAYQATLGVIRYCFSPLPSQPCPEVSNHYYYNNNGSGCQNIMNGRGDIDISHDNRICQRGGYEGRPSKCRH
ncbi:hypothetical protein BDN72DRAFT_847457 [Pluteus cervinus]|uniref:Uncharacterized protein n=1 Tax=Pluteus cervinus TaxID=181527 RepID=A0ACD3ADF7_9AGAR|nr:hypothetical protein BDN72DRAFT_847457 [Pluteus cervinus]